MSNLNYISAEARAKRIAKKIAQRNKAKELVEFLDSAIKSHSNEYPEWELNDFASEKINIESIYEIQPIVMTQYGEVNFLQNDDEISKELLNIGGGVVTRFEADKPFLNSFVQVISKGYVLYNGVEFSEFKNASINLDISKPLLNRK